MKVYLHLADSGLVLADLSLRAYDTEGNTVSLSPSSVTLTALVSGIDYVLDGIPDVPASFSGLTLTYETPTGVYHSRVIGNAALQPSRIIIPIREVFEDPINDLEIKVFNGAIEYAPISVSMLPIDGEYSVSGWSSPSNLGENWSVRWVYNDQVYSVEWTGIKITGGVKYISISALQPPFSIGNDSSNRAMLSFNLISSLVGNPTTTCIHIASLISAAGLGTLGTSLWYGSKAQIPQTGAGPFISLVATGGLSSLQTHNNDKQSRPTVQVITRAESYTVAESRANQIYAVLDGKHNVSI